jgi:hypothetical protein
VASGETYRIDVAGEVDSTVTQVQGEGQVFRIEVDSDQLNVQEGETLRFNSWNE